MKKRVYLFLLINFTLLSALWITLLILHANLSVMLFLLCIVIMGFFGYRIFIQKNRENTLAIRKLLEEKKWDDIIEGTGVDNELIEQLGLIFKEYAKDVKREHSVQIMDKQVQISTLQSQINPHFLYNTMESIRGQALSEGSIEIARMAESLSSFFRYSIDQKGNIVTVQDELKNIQNYLFIQRYRFEDKFDMEMRIDDEDDNIYDYLLPKLTIQPIVENAIYHGLETKYGKGHLTITVTSTQKRLLITISDDGIGMSPDVLASINHNLRKGTTEIQEDRISYGEGTGLALMNVNHRINLVFGNDYGIHVYSTLNRGTDVEIVLPLIRGREKLDNLLEDPVEKTV